MADYKVTVGVDIQSKGLDALEKRLEAFAKKTYTANVNVNSGSISKGFDDAIKNIDKSSDKMDKSLKRKVDGMMAKQAEINRLKGDYLNAGRKQRSSDWGKQQLAEIARVESEYAKMWNSLSKKEKRMVNARINAARDSQNSKLASSNREIQSQKNELNGILRNIEKLDKVRLTEGKGSKSEIARNAREQLKYYQSERDRILGDLGKSLTSAEKGRYFDKVKQSDANIESVKAKIGQLEKDAVVDIKARIDNGSFQNAQRKIETQLNKLSRFGDTPLTSEARSSFANMQNAYTRLTDVSEKYQRGLATEQDVLRAYDDYDRHAKSAKNFAGVQQSLANDARDLQKIQSKGNKLLADMETWQNRNSRAMKKYGSEFRAIKQDLTQAIQMGDIDKINKAQAGYNKIIADANQSGLTQATYLQQTMRKIGSLASYYTVSSVMFGAMAAAADAFRNVVQVDTAMTELMRVTDLTTTDYANIYSDLTTSAKEYGATLSDMISSTADWVKQGFDTKDAVGLSEVSSMYQHIGDITKQEANENLITAYNGYKEELMNLYDGDAVKAVGYAGDVYNEIGNNFAITSGQVGDGMTRAASALSFAGNTFQEATGMITGVTEVTQDPTKAGTAMKILSLRLRGMKGELEEVESGASEGVESISKMQTQVLNMTGGKVNLFDDTGSFKSTYDIMQGIAEVWDELSSIDQANLLETIAGKNRANDVAALIDNWDRVEEATEAAYGAEGSASKEHEKYLDSIQGRITTLQATWQTLSNTLVNSDFAKGAISGFTGILDVLNTIIDTVGLLPLLMGVGGLMTKGFGLMKWNEQAGKMETSIGKMVDSFKELRVNSNFKFGNEFAKSLKANQTALNGFVKDFNKTGDYNAAWNKNLLNSNETTRQIAQNMKLLDVANAATSTQKQHAKQHNANQIRAAQKMVEAQMKLNEVSNSVSKTGGVLNPQNWKNLNSAVGFFNNQMSKVGISQTQFATQMGAVDTQMGKYFSTMKQGQASVTGLISSMAGNKVLGLLRGFISTIGGTAMAMGATMLVSAAFSKISEWYVSAEELSTKVDDIVTKFDESKKSIKSANDLLNDSGLRYAELSKGVNSLGENLSLTSAEYQEYIDLSNQLAETFPNLIQGYDASGNAILSHRGDVEALTDAYKELKKEAYEEVLKGEDGNNAEDIFQDFKNKKYDMDISEDTANTIESMLEANDLSAEEINEALKSTNTTHNTGEIARRSLTSNMNISNAHVISNLFRDNGFEREIGETYDEHVKRVMQEDKSAAQEILDNYEEIDSDITEGMKSLAEAYVGKELLDDKYENMPSALQTILTSMPSNMDTEYLRQFGTVEGFYESLDSIISEFNNLGEAEQQDLEFVLELETKLNGGEISVGEYVDGLTDFETLLANMDVSDEVKEQIKLTVGLEGEDSIKKDYEKLSSSLTDDLGMGAEAAEQLAYNLSSEHQLTAVLDLIANGQISKDTLIDGTDINMIQQYTDEFNKLKALSNVTGLDPLTTRFGNVDLSNADRVIEWNEKNLEKYKSQLMSWNETYEDEDGNKHKLTWKEVKGEYKDSVATVEGGSKTIEGIDIAYTPYLETDDGLELLSKNVVDDYIDGIFKKAKEDDGKVDAAELLSFDMTGLEIDGKRISNLIAGVGRNAKNIGEMMHYAGENGALAMTELMQVIEREAKVQQALSYEIDIEAETSGIESVKTALTETMAATGVTETSVTALTSRFAGLSAAGKTVTDLFEATATGLRMNTDVFYELEDALATQQLDETTGHLETMKEELGRVEKTIKDASSTTEEVSWAMGRRDELLAHMNLLGQQAALYEGLTNKYAEWQRAEAEDTGNNRDMYEAVLTGHDTVKDELSRGWADDGTIKYLELLTGKTDLAGKTLQEVRGVFKSLDNEIGDTGYSINDFFTVDSEGNSTSQGVWNFLKTINAMDGKIGDAVTKHKDGSYTFDFEVAGGDEAIAEALGVSEELVDIMLNAAKDAGFEVNFEGQYEEYAKIVSSAEQAQKDFNNINKSTADNVDYDFGSSDLETVIKQAEDAENLLDQYKRFTNKEGDPYLKRNKQGEVIDQNGNVLEGGKEALEMASTLLMTRDRLSDPVYMSIDASTLSDELQEPTEKLQEYDRLLAKRNQLELKGRTGSKAYKKNAEAMKDTLDYFKDIRDEGGDLAESLGIDDMSDTELQTALDNQTLTIPTELELTASIDESLQQLVDIAKIEKGLLDPVEVPWYFEESTGAKIDGIDFSKYDDTNVDSDGNTEVDIVTKFVTDEKELLNTLNGKGRQIVVDFYLSNPEMWNELSKGEKEVVIKFVENNNNVLSKYSEEDQQKLIEFRLANPDAFNNFLSLSEGQREVVFNAILKNPNFLDGFDASQHDVLINFIANNPDFFTKYDDPVEQQIVLDYIAQNGEEAWNELGEDGQQKYIKANLKMVPESTEQAKEDVRQATKEGASEGTSQGVSEGASKGASEVAAGDGEGKGKGKGKGKGGSESEGSGEQEAPKKIKQGGGLSTGADDSLLARWLSKSKESEKQDLLPGETETYASDGVLANFLRDVAKAEPSDEKPVAEQAANEYFQDKAEQQNKTAKFWEDLFFGGKNDGKSSEKSGGKDTVESNKESSSSEQTVKLTPDTSEVDNYQPEDKTATATFDKDSSQPDGYQPDGKTATATFNKDSSQPDSYQPGPKFGLATFGKDSRVPDAYQPDPKSSTVTFQKDSSAVDNYSPPTGKTLWVSVKAKISGFLSGLLGGESPAAGTAHSVGSAFSNGTSGRAFARGDWGIKGNGVALGGELGQELVVRDGRFFTIGDQGAEFFKYKKNDIVFNASQTASLFKYGGIKGANPRGKMFASGSAFAGGSFPSSGRAFAGSYGGGGSEPTFGDSSSKNSGGTGSSGNNNNNNNNKNNKSNNKDFKEVFDWIEIAIDRLERKIERLGKTADSVYKTWKQRNKALSDSIKETRNEIDLQWRGYNRYIKQANSVTISKNKATDAKYKKLVREGKIDIETIKNEKLAEKIKEYQEWYEKALDCKDAIDELGESLAELYSQKFDLVVTQFESQLTQFEHANAMLEEHIAQSEAKGHIASTKQYEKLIKYENQEINKLEAQKKAMKAAMDEAVNSGVIAVGSEEWWRMQDEINGVTQEIEASKTAILEYEQSIREAEWEKFDLLQDKISNIITETEFLIDLMSNKELYNEDTGQLTKEGMATMGLHAENYDVNMKKAEEYAAEIARLDAQIAADPDLADNKEFMERRQEMVEAQQDSILAAEQEKEAIRDMVEEGINLELDALQERIDKYNEALDSQKD